MPALATTLLTKVKEALDALFAGPPAVPVAIRRASDMNPFHWPGLPIPGLVVACNEAQDTDGMTARKVLCTYLVTVSYLSKELPGQRDDDPDVRTKQEAIRKAFDVAAWAPVPEVSQIDPKIKKPYTLPTKDQTVNVASVTLRIETIESRN